MANGSKQNKEGGNVMGLDQSFYSKKPKVDSHGFIEVEPRDEVFYFRKYPELHGFISDIVGGAGNGEMVRLYANELTAIKDFLIEDKNWRFNTEDGDEYSFKPTRDFFELLGKLTYYAENGDSIYYIGDW